MQLRTILTRLLLMGVVALFVMGSTVWAVDPQQHTTSVFQGVKVNGGTAMHFRENGKSFLKVSDDFKIPDTPDPHWQVVDSKGETHRLQALKVKDGLSNRQIEVPHHVRDVVKVQIWCAFAETLLGEASFSRPVR